MTDSGADLMQRIAEFGADNAIDQQAAFTLPLVVEQQKQRLSHLTQPQEYEYGTHERHKLDVYPAQSHDRHSERPPLLLFLPGGGFAVGDKRAAPGVYAGLANYFAAHGFCVVVMNYRLLRHGAIYPDGASDLAQALAWIGQGNLGNRADCNSVYLFGESAGGMHIATLLYGKCQDFQSIPSIPGISLRGVVYLSAPFGGASPLPPNWQTYYGGEAAFQDHSPIALRRASSDRTPTLIVSADFDISAVRSWVEPFRNAVQAAGAPVQTIEATGHNHVSPAASVGLNEKADRWCQTLIQWAYSRVILQ